VRKTLAPWALMALIWFVPGGQLPAQTLTKKTIALAPPAINVSGFTLPAKENKNATADIIHAFEAPETNAYEMSDGDQVFVDVFGRPELSGRHIIGPDGRITLPLVGPLVLSGKTREEAQTAITESLTRYYSDLSVTVRIDQYSSFRIMVLGRVGSPGPVTFDHQPTLLEAITKAVALPVGGFGADKSNMVRCAIFRGRDRVIWIDLKQLLTQEQLDLNIRLARNDLLYLPDANDQLIYVLGYVKTPGAIHLTPSMSFLDALSLAGGPTEDSEPNHISLIRPNAEQQVEVPFKQILAGRNNLNYSLEEGDILYVPPRKMAKFGYVMQRISPISSFAILGTLAR
jgi:polysaccharide biosynthesis/export protein